MRSIGAWLIIAFGAFLTFGGGGENGITVGAVPCPQLSAIVQNPCPTGTLQVVKTISGTAPQANWSVTVSSSNCAAALVGRQDLVMSIPPGGGTASVAGLELYTDSSQQTLCQYTLTETPVSAWTPSFTPTGPYTLVADGTVSVALLNTADTTTTAAPTTTTIAPTTTLAPTTTVAGTTTLVGTVAPTTTAGGSGAGVPSSVVLPATGSSRSGTQTFIGVGLMVVGASLLVLRRRSDQVRPAGE